MPDLYFLFCADFWIMASHAKTFEEISAERIAASKARKRDRTSSGSRAVPRKVSDDGATDLTRHVDPVVGVPDKGVGPCSKSHTGTPPDMSKALVTPAAKTAPASKGSAEPTAASGSTPASTVNLGKSPLREEERVEPVVVNVEEGGDGGSADKRPPKKQRLLPVDVRKGESLLVTHGQPNSVNQEVYEELRKVLSRRLDKEMLGRMSYEARRSLERDLIVKVMSWKLYQLILSF